MATFWSSAPPERSPRRAPGGTSPHGFADYGESLIVDPWGRVLARASEGEGVITAEIDRAYLARVRRELPCLAHVRLGV